MQSNSTTQVRFFEAKRDSMERPILGPPNARTVNALGLQNDVKARIGFKVKGTVIFAKRATPGVLSDAWDSLMQRSKNRRRAAEAARMRLEKRVKELPNPNDEITQQVTDRMNKVRSQLEISGTVAARDLQSLFDAISDAEKTDAANQVQLKFNASVKDAAAELHTLKTLSFILRLGQPANPQFPTTTVSNFLNFIKITAALDLDAVGPKPLDYTQAHAFARAWTDALPKSALGKPEDRYLIDRLAKLVLEACKSPEDAEPQSAPQFRWKNEESLERISDNALFVRDDNFKFGQGGNGSVSAYTCGAESLVAKKLIQNETDPSRTLEALAEARVHTQACQDADHIVGIHGTVVTGDGAVLIILQHASNGESATVRTNLDKAVKDGDLSPEAASRAKMLMFVDMLKGADQAHANGVMHLDLKPENYFVDAVGRMLLGDFGTSRGVLGDVGKPGIASIDYTAPEINSPYKECPITYMSDIWPLGVMLYELFSPRKEDEKFAATALRPFPYVESHEGRDSIEQFLKEKNPAKRFKQLHLNPLGPNHQLHRLIMEMLDPDPLKRPALKTVLDHPLFARYANPMNDEEDAIVADARATILAHVGPAER